MIKWEISQSINMKQPKVTRSLNFPQDLAKKIAELAEKEDRNFTQMVIVLCREALLRREEK